MPRRREVVRRDLAPDQKHNNRLVARFINNLFTRGKKSTAETILYGAFDIIENGRRSLPWRYSRRPSRM